MAARQTDPVAKQFLALHCRTHCWTISADMVVIAYQVGHFRRETRTGANLTAQGHMRILPHPEVVILTPLCLYGLYCLKA